MMSAISGRRHDMGSLLTIPAATRADVPAILALMRERGLTAEKIRDAAPACFTRLFHLPTGLSHLMLAALHCLLNLLISLHGLCSIELGLPLIALFQSQIALF